MDETLEHEAMSAPDPAELHWRKAVHFLDVDRPDLAKGALGELLRLEPDHTPALSLLALCEYLDDQPEDAEARAHEALGLDPGSSEALMVLGLMRMDEGRHRESEAHLLEVLRIEPDSAWAYGTYAQLMFKTGHLDKAEALLQEALRIDPEDVRAHNLLANLLSEKERHMEAGGHAHKSLQLDPTEDSGHLAQGLVDLRSGHPFRARRHFREALRLDPGPAAEELFLQADRCCRWIYLPMCWWTMAAGKVPGGSIGIWAIFVGLMLLSRAHPRAQELFGYVAIAYLATVLYTWIADLLISAWIRILPPRFDR